MNIVLIEPKMPSNTGNIMRLCANTNSTLHIVGPIFFSLEEKKLKRAGLDYRDWAKIKTYKSWKEFNNNQKLIGCSSKAKKFYTDINYSLDSWLVFGSETEGIRQEIREDGNWSDWATIPMHPNSRSLNLANSVSVVLYEALRQTNFVGLKQIQV